MKDEKSNQKASHQKIDDEALEKVTGGSGDGYFIRKSYDGACPYCKSTNVSAGRALYYCNDCKKYFDYN